MATSCSPVSTAFPPVTGTSKGDRGKEAEPSWRALSLRPPRPSPVSSPTSGQCCKDPLHGKVHDIYESAGSSSHRQYRHGPDHTRPVFKDHFEGGPWR